MKRYLLSLNCGSSSLKFNLFSIMQGNRLIPFTGGIIEEIGSIENSRLKYEFQGEKIIVKEPVKTHREALSMIFKQMAGHEIKTESICAVGHRVVHGGDRYSSSVLIDKSVINTIRSLIPIAPLHNPPNLTGIEEAMKLLPGIPQVAVFDTAFHAGMPEYAYRYAIPGKWYKSYGVRKYGFHGTSHMYVARRAARILGKPFNKFSGITVHLGNGCSIAKIHNGISVDTSMGFTPLQGLIMGTRSGDIDPALIQHVVNNISEEEGIGKDISFERVMMALNKESGLKAIGNTNMMQNIREKALQGDEEADRIIDIYSYRVAHYIGAYWAGLSSTDAVVFTAGLGENEGYVRKKILSFMPAMKIIINDEKNAMRKHEVEIGRNNTTSVFVIPTDEEIVIGYDTLFLGYLRQKLPESYPFEE